MPKPPLGHPPKKLAPVQDVGETTRLPPLIEPNDTGGEPEATDETVEVTNPLARIPLRPESPRAISNETRVDRHSGPLPLPSDPSVDMTIPLPRILEVEPAPAPLPPAASTRVEGLPAQPTVLDEPPAARPDPKAERDSGKPVDVARRATVLKINPETIQSWLTEGPSGEHKAQTPGGFRPLIEDLKDELEAESKNPSAAEGQRRAEDPGKPAPLPMRPSSDRNPRHPSHAEVSTAPKVVLREPIRSKAKKLSSTLSMLLKQEASRRRRGFVVGLLSVLFLAGLGFFAYVYLVPLLLPLLKR
ncbi:MAG: hypothetical protein QM765_44945 [Myxococcales bacterium]